MVAFTQSLNNFNNIHFKNADTIVNVRNNGEIKSNGKLGGMFRFMRSSEAKAQNNEARTALLKSLADSFGLKYQDKGNGKVSFSNDLLNKLEKLIGPEFKKGNFALNSKGEVSSGKPLTQRRVSAIMKNAKVFESTGFNVEVYRSKLNAIKKDLGLGDLSNLSNKQLNDLAMSKGDNSNLYRMFISIEKSLNFLEKELNDCVKLNYNYEAEIDIGDIDPDEKLPFSQMFEYKDPKTGNYKPLADLNDWNATVLMPKVNGNLIHVENAKMYNSEGLGTVDGLKKYIKDTIQMYVKSGIDSFIESKAHNKMEALKNHCIEDGGACMEDQGKKFYKYMQDNFEAKVDKKLESELEAAILGSNKPEVLEPIQKQMEKELVIIFTANPDESKENCLKVLEEKFIGKSVPMVKAGEKKNGMTELEFEMKDGNFVVKNLTKEDVDMIGTIVYNNIDMAA